MYRFGYSRADSGFRPAIWLDERSRVSRHGLAVSAGAAVMCSIAPILCHLTAKLTVGSRAHRCYYERPGAACLINSGRVMSTRMVRLHIFTNCSSGGNGGRAVALIAGARFAKKRPATAFGDH